MATHARQQYNADETTLQKQLKEFSIQDDVREKIQGIEEGAQVNTIETINVNGSEVLPDQDKAIDLTIPGVVDSLDSTSSTDALSAKQGKVLYDYIQDVSHIGHFLALWNASTGLPVTNPDTSPYIYNTGDFYTISVVASGGGTNYRPDGTQYVIGQASTTVETENVSVNDFYFYDGTTWRHMVNSGTGSIAIDGSLSTTSTNPVENRVITNAINGKADVTDSNTKTFYLSGTGTSAAVLATAQEAYDWYLAGKNPIIQFGGFGGVGINLIHEMFMIGPRSSDAANEFWFFNGYAPKDEEYAGTTPLVSAILKFSISSGTVTGVTLQRFDGMTGGGLYHFLDTFTPYSTPYQPLYPGSPATKKYVDDHAGKTYTAGANIQISAQDVISATDTTYTAGTGISIDANNVISNTQTSAEWGNITGTLSDQTDLQNALNAKANNVDLNTKTFHLLSTSDYTNAQAAYDYLQIGGNPIIEYDGTIYTYWRTVAGGRSMGFRSSRNNREMASGDDKSNITIDYITINTDSSYQVNSIIVGDGVTMSSYLDTDVDYATPYTPQYNGSPATKKYVDDQVSAATAGAVSDTTYGSSWDGVTGIAPSKNAVYDKINAMDTTIAGKQNTLTAGSNISISGNTISATDTIYNAGRGIEIGDISDYSAMQGPAPTGYHVPSTDEWAALCGILTSTFSMDANATTMGTYLKMPMAGSRGASSNISSVGSNGRYWSSTIRSSDSAYRLGFDSSSLNPQDSSSRATGFSIRCFKDVPAIPDSSWTTLYDGSSIATGAGVFYNTIDGLISVSGNGQTWYTIQDKNLGATIVFNQGDTVSDANCGYFYQWGNNYGFAHSGTITTSSTQVDASSYGPGNYYNSSTFITRSSTPRDWSSVRNDNLWGGVTGVITLDNAITNTGVLSVNGQTGNITIEGGDVSYSDFAWDTATGATVTLKLNTEITPSANFTVNAPATIKDGQTYILRVTNGATAYTMTLGTNITNPYSTDTTLTANGVDQFVFLAIGGNLELQPDAEGGSGITKIFTLSSTSDLTTAQEAVDRYNNGGNPIIKLTDGIYGYYHLNEVQPNRLGFHAAAMAGAAAVGYLWGCLYSLNITLTNGTTVSSITLNKNDIALSSSAPSSGTTNSRITLVI